MKNDIVLNYSILSKVNDVEYGEIYKINYILDNEEKLAYLKIIDYQKISDYSIREEVLSKINVITKITNNPYIINYYKVVDNSEEGKIYIISEYLETLENSFNDKKWSEKEVINLSKNILLGLASLHVNNVAHNSININNIYLGNDTYKLGDIDFFNTISEFSPKTDISLVGILMYQLLSGKLPFELESSGAVLEVLKNDQTPSYLDNVSSELMNIIIKAMDLNSTEHYPDVGKMYDDLNGISINEDTVVLADGDTAKKSGDTLDFSNPLAKSKLYDNYINIRRKYTLRDFLKRVLSIFFLVVLVALSFVIWKLTFKCSAGKINKFGICVKGHYECPDGYDVSGNKCRKIIKKIPATKNYYCPDNYIYSNDLCVYKTSKKPKKTYMCADDFKLNDKKCIQEISAQAPVIYSCPDNYVLAGTLCVTLNSFEASKSYSCPDDTYTRSGAVCTKNTQISTNAIVTYGCSKGGSYSNGKCYLVQSPIYDANNNPVCPSGYDYSDTDGKCNLYYAPTPTYSCITGTSDGNGHCIRDVNASVPAIPNYTCPDGYAQVGNMCTNSASIDAKAKYVCTDEMELVDGVCHGKVVTDALELYTCPDGYVLSGVMCLKDNFKEPEVKYTCSRVYKLNNDSCVKYKVVNATPVYD